MADKREAEKGLNVEPEKVKDTVAEPNAKEQPLVEVLSWKEEGEQQLSSLDLLWRHGFRELDEGAKRANNRDAIFLKAAKQFAEGTERNQGNLIELAAQFYQELLYGKKQREKNF